MRKEITSFNLTLSFGITEENIQQKLPKVEKSLEDLLIRELNDKVFVKDEYEVCIGNRYYRHIDFEKINENLR